VANQDLAPYQEITDPDFAECAARDFEIAHLDDDILILRGPCPRCGAILEVPLVDRMFDGMRSIRKHGATSEPAQRVEPVSCTCEEQHPNRPDARSGCGAYWTFALTAGP
jgi:hypothetical protein